MLLDKPVNSIYHGKWQYIIVIVVVVIELSRGHKILKVEAIVIPIFQMRSWRSSMVSRLTHRLVSYAALFITGLSFLAFELNVSQNVFSGKLFSQTAP